MQKLIISILIVSAIISCKSEKRKKADPNIPPKYAISEPKFADDGDLYFISNNDTLALIDIEIADTYKTREQGLMYRRSMKENRGMLFIFEREERQTFWMKNTHIPLDLIFVNNDLRIVHIAKNAQPYSLKQIPSFEYARYVVEVNAGYCGKYKVNVGNYIAFIRN